MPPVAALNRRMLAPYVPRILLSATDHLGKMLFPGCGEKFVQNLVGSFNNNKQLLLEVLENGDVTRLKKLANLKPEKAMEICDLWKKHHCQVEHVVMQKLPKKWKIEDCAMWYEFECEYVANQYESLQDLVWCKNSLQATKKFLLARYEAFHSLPIDWQIQIQAKAILYSSNQVCLGAKELYTELEEIANHSQVERALLETDPLQLFIKHEDYYYLNCAWKDTIFVAKNFAKRIRRRGFSMPGYDLKAADLHLLSGSQRQAVELAMRCSVFILTGGPGTGKTFVLGKLIKCWEAAGNDVVVCTYTARGANNLKKVALASQATTIHSTLGAVRRNKDAESKDSSFLVNQVQCDVFILDEATLVDLRLMRHILERLNETAVVVVVGDKDQLPSIGPGSVFRDLLQIGHKHGGMYRLSEAKRYTSQLDLFANAILKGLPALDMLKTLKRCPNSEIVWIPISTQEAELSVAKVIAEILQNVEDKDSVQVLVKQSAKHWNQSVLKRLFTGSESKKYEVGDRVMHLVNDYNRNIVNGEIGNVSEVGVENVKVFHKKQGYVITPRDFVIVRYLEHGEKDKFIKYVGTEELEQLTFAYAISVHKAQGCEFHTVILVASGYPKWTREMFYTACTRTRYKLYVLGAEWDLKHAMKQREPYRNSQLVQIIETELAAI